jgi:hypothetical protein
MACAVADATCDRLSESLPGAGSLRADCVGLRIPLEEPDVLMAWRPFGNWCNYLPRAPGFL